MGITEQEIRAHFDAMSTGDWERVSRIMADDFVQDWPQSGERIRGREACTNINRNYPGGGPTGSIRRISGGGDFWTVEIALDYGGTKVHQVAILEFRGGQLIHETDYWGDPFEAPAWRSQWVEMVEPAMA